jgi:hypothetical protein
VNLATVDPASPTLANPAFAELVIIVLAGVLIVLAMWDWLRGR